MKVSEKNSTVETIYQIYRSLEDEIANQKYENIYTLLDISNNIFQAAIQEMNENESKAVTKDNRRSNAKSSPKTTLFDLSMIHLRNCSRERIDNNTVQWIEYSLKMLRYSYVRSTNSLESSLSSCIESCVSSSKLHWIEHDLMKKFWDVLWNRIENRLGDSTILCHYIQTVVTILENVEPIVLEPSIQCIIRKIIKVMKVEPNGKCYTNSSWSHSKKFAYAYLFSFIVDRWGLEGRDLLIEELSNIVPHLSSLITVEPCLSQDSKFLTMKLVDDMLKLATIGKIRTLNEELAQKIICITSNCVVTSLKSAHSLFFNRQNFLVNSKYISFIARWIIAQRHFVTWNIESGDTECCEPDNFGYNDIVNLRFGESISPFVNRCNAWNFCIEVLKEIVDSRYLPNSEVIEMVTVLWQKRKCFATDKLRCSFCLLLCSLIEYDINFGQSDVPSIDSILKYSLSLMSNLTSLPSSSRLTETILRVRSNEISKDLHRLICDTVSRTNASSLPVLRVISAFISFTEFDENTHFCSILNNEERPWTFRKDIIDWLLANQNPMVHRLIFQLCQFHPAFCYEENIVLENEDTLLDSMKKLNLIRPTTSQLKHSSISTNSTIREIVDYADTSVTKSLESEFTFTSFLITWELKKSLNIRYEYLSMYATNIRELSEYIDESEYREIVSNFSTCPYFLKLPDERVNYDTVIAYIIVNLKNEKFPYEDLVIEKDLLFNRLLEKIAQNVGLKEKLQQSQKFNDFVKHFIFANISDIYETAKKFSTYAVFLSSRNLVTARLLIIKTTADYLRAGTSIEESDAFLIEEIVTSTCIRLATEKARISGYDLDPYVVAYFPDHVEYDEKNVVIFLKRLKHSPYLAQNIVRHVLTDGKLWRIHSKVLNYVFNNEQLLLVCLSNFPKMKLFFKAYQFCLNPTSRAAHIMKLNCESIKKCQKYVKKPKINGESINVDDLFVLLSVPSKKWTRLSFRFWSIFRKQPHLVCEVLYNYAKLNIQIGLVSRILRLIRALAYSEFRVSVNEHKALHDIFTLICRPIFQIALEVDSSSEILDLCFDDNFRFDYSKHHLKIDIESSNFETNTALNIETYLKCGVETSNVDLMQFGNVEFYYQLNENLSIEMIETNDKRGVFIIDLLSSVWRIIPTMRPHILPIVARFKHVSPIWHNFPQPPHSVADENTFVYRLRFNLALQILSIRQFQKFELASNILLYLSTYDSNFYDDVFLNTITKLYGNNRLSDSKSVICNMGLKLRNFSKCTDFDSKMIELALIMSSLFKSIGMFVVPFLFFVCVNVHDKYDYAVELILTSTSNTREDSNVISCIAECVDSIGINILAMCEKADGSMKPQFHISFFYSLSELFLNNGFLNHSFAIANLIFDRIAIKHRNLMMIDRISLADIPNSSKLIDLLVKIYVADRNAVSLSSLPSDVQERPEVLKVTLEKAKDWLKLIKCCVLNDKELTLAKWKCGIQDLGMQESSFLDLLLRCQFTNYPKHPTDYSKIAYVILFHLPIPSSKLDVNSLIEKAPNMSIEDFRLIMIANGDPLFEPISVEENAVYCIRLIRETILKRHKREYSSPNELSRKTKSVTQVAKILLENNCLDASIGLFKEWEAECMKWPNGYVDIDLIEIFRNGIIFESGNVRTAETNLRLMFSRIESMSDVALCEYSLIFGDIIFKRNEYDETIRLLEMGAQRLKESSSIDSRLRILLKFHSLCMDQLSRLEEYRESLGFRMKVKAISAFEEQIKVVSRSSGRMSSSNTDESRRAVQRVRREQQCEKDDVENVERNVATAAIKAISSAFDALNSIAQLIDVEDGVRKASLIIFPLIDVMYKYEKNEEIVAIVKSYACTKLVSRLWLCATSHIASKCFSGDGSMLKKALYYVLARLVLDYPYHVLHTLLMYENGPNGAEVRQFIDSMPKKKANRDLVRLDEIIGEMRMAHAAYKQLAKLDVKNENLQKISVEGKGAYVVPKDLKIFKCKLDKLPIPIISQSVGKAGDYSLNGIITWKSWKATFMIADGLSAPKIWEIQGSDGRWYKTVWKKDDVRQDVLVEQMFNVTNCMLNSRILRTYNIVPIDTECGIIEFCGGTISIKELLCGSNRDGGLHRDLNPNEPSATLVSMEMKRCQQESAAKRREIFVNICNSYSPVFRHFFYTNFPTAHIWKQKIEEYRKSLASWSVVCYIVGLGDRHASNILFDQNSCHFVHIDLGMILEYSKRTLPVPEQVPFRLSRDFMDPILIEGIEYGHLADICNVTIEELKKNGKVILGVASALLRETMTNFRETEIVANRPSYISEMAIRRLREKLEGTDHGVSSQSSTVQIRRLLKEATSADNLSRMFCGWMPFL